jgi:uncharacterized membrane protein (UPF0127 family)
VTPTTVWPRGKYVRLPFCSEQYQRIYVEVMRTPAERSAGLRGRAALAPNHGMLFVHDSADFWTYTMLGCLINLDILWLDARGRVVDQYIGASPCRRFPCSSYRPIAPACYVLELLGGVSAVLGIWPGAMIDLSGALS